MTESLGLLIQVTQLIKVQSQDSSLGTPDHGSILLNDMLVSACLSVCSGKFSILKFSSWFEILGLFPGFVR